MEATELAKIAEALRMQVLASVVEQNRVRYPKETVQAALEQLEAYVKRGS